MNRFSIALTISVLAVSGCASTSPDPGHRLEQEAGASSRLLEDGTHLLAQGNAVGARQLFAEAAARDVTDPTRQTLLGLSYQADAGKGTDALRLAQVGYEAALKSAPGDYWAGALAGQVAFDLGDYRGATEHFAHVALNHPHRAEPFSALAVSAYQSGDLALALLAAQRAEALARKTSAALPLASAGENQGGRAPRNDRVLASALRVTTLAHAARGDDRAMNQAMDRWAQIEPQTASGLEARTAQLIGTAAIDEEPMPRDDDDNDDESTDADTPSDNGAGTDPGSSGGSKQISVDVVILLAQHERIDRVGINLLDGLKLQFGGSNSRSDVRNNDGSSFERTITKAITLPDLTYNLNIFNRLGSYYEVAARPSLTAHLGEQSEFFVGKSLRVAIKGVNDSTLEKVDVGIELKARPIEIDDSGAKLKISAERSFLQDQPVGTFAEGLSTFRQFVSATARVKFGETLVLSGLSENVTDSTGSKTPIIGDLPLIGRAFNQRTKDQRRGAVLILVTPSRPAQFTSRPWARGESVQRMIDLWDKVVDPSTNASSVTASLSKIRMFSRMQKGDAPLAWPSGTEDLESLGKAILNIKGH
jgi:Tfp pilus assembly protein PilF